MSLIKPARRRQCALREIEREIASRSASVSVVASDNAPFALLADGGSSLIVCSCDAVDGWMAALDPKWPFVEVMLVRDAKRIEDVDTIAPSHSADAVG